MAEKDTKKAKGPTAAQLKVRLAELEAEKETLEADNARLQGELAHARKYR